MDFTLLGSCYIIFIFNLWRCTKLSDKNKRDLSLSDINIKIDLDMEQESKKYPRKDVFKKKEPQETKTTQNTLDLYKDEMSRAQVEKLLQSHHAIKETEAASANEDLSNLDEAEVAATAETKITKAETETKVEAVEAMVTTETITPDATSEASDDEKDYQYILSLLGESKKEDDGSAESASHEHRRSSRRTPPKKENAALYTTVRVFLASVFILFLLSFATLVVTVTSTQKALVASNLEVEKLKANSETYERMKIELDGIKIDRDQLEGENNLLKLELAQLKNDTTGDVSSEQTSEQISSNDSGGPQRYTTREGDSFWRISSNFYKDGTLYKEIMAANNIRNESDIFPGMELIIPNLGGTHAN